MRIALIDRPDPADRPAPFNRFTAVGQVLKQAGHEVLMLEGAPIDLDAVPILTGLNRARAGAPLIQTHALAHHLAGLRPDLIIGPLRGGILQGMLMARACQEAFAASRIAAWYDTPTRTRFFLEEDLPYGLEPLIADALERQVATFADAIILPSEVSATALSGWHRHGTIFHSDKLPAPLASRRRPFFDKIEEIVFVGPLRRHRGVVEFIAAMERLAGDGLLNGRIVTFLGSARTLALGIGRDWLGFRAASWKFPFKIVRAIDEEERHRYLTGAGRLAVVVAHDSDELLEIQRYGSHHICLLHGSDGPRQTTDRVERAVRTALSRGPIARPDISQAHWPTLIDKIMMLPLASNATETSRSDGVSVCIVHRNRLAYLAEAFASIPNQINGGPVELLIIDNASDIPSAEEKIREIAGQRDLLRIVAFTKPIPQASALNHAIGEARHKTVIFLDDDNSFTASGVERLARAVTQGDFDIVVTSLEVFDDGALSTSTVGRLTFVGAARSAGLFFNAFGDTAMAVRRDAFLALGGFHDPGYSYSSLDWVTLAKAQTAGLRIGVLQWPAVRYRRNTEKADLEANKIDQEGARWFVFEAYGGALDGELVARYAQKLQLEEW